MNFSAADEARKTSPRRRQRNRNADNAVGTKGNRLSARRLRALRDVLIYQNDYITKKNIIQ